jgi:hypothetical protein
MGEMEIGTGIQTGNGLGYTIRRAWSGQGWIYKNVEAFYHAPSQVCYVPEGSDRTYTASDFMELSLGQPEIAEEMFLSVGWECPASWLDEQFRMGELAICPVCGRICQCYPKIMCMHGQEAESDRG